MTYSYLLPGKDGSVLEIVWHRSEPQHISVISEDVNERYAEATFDKDELVEYLESVLSDLRGS